MMDKYDNLRPVLKKAMDDAIEAMGYEAASKISFFNIVETENGLYMQEENE